MGGRSIALPLHLTLIFSFRTNSLITSVRLDYWLGRYKSRPSVEMWPSG